MYKVRPERSSKNCNMGSAQGVRVVQSFSVISQALRESVSRYKQPLRICMRNKILRSANAKYHYSYLFFYKINKRRRTFYLLLCFLV